MQDGLTKTWESKGHRKGTFEGYNVMGFQYEDQAGEIGWHTKSWKLGFDPVHDFWVADGVFYSMRIHYFYQGRNTQIEIIGPITDLDASERSAVLMAISEWKKSQAA
jgi:hypothetical protein